MRQSQPSLRVYKPAYSEPVLKPGNRVVAERASGIKLPWSAWLDLLSLIFAPLTSSWPHLRCGVSLEEGEYRENCLCLAVLCTIIMVHKDTSSSYRSVNCIGL